MDPAKMKVVDLRSELSALGLDTKGNKPALVDRLKKALESKTGKNIVDTTILDTSTEDVDEVPTPHRAGPACRTRRRSSSMRTVSTPAKLPPREEPELISEEVSEDSDKNEPIAAQQISHEIASSEDSNSEDCIVTETKAQKPESQRPDEEVQCIDDQRQPSPILIEDADDVKKKEIEEPMETNQEESDGNKEDSKKPQPEKEKIDSDKAPEIKEEVRDEEEQSHPLTEEEEWEQLNERLRIRERERIEREKRQAEEDEKKLEAIKNDPVKLQRMTRKREKKERWSNFYRNVEVTNEVLAPIVEDNGEKKREPSPAKKLQEPELNDERITLSWYDSDLNQYLELPELASVVPLTDGAFAHAWAGTRASHGVTSGRVCFEVRMGAVVTTTEDNTGSGLRIGWSTDDSSLHLGEGKSSWGYDNSGRAVTDSEFKDYGKQFNEKDVIGAYLDLESKPCKVSYTVNGEEQGVAFEFDKEDLAGRTVYPHILTKNICYRVNFGYDKYNMLTKTKIVRHRLEIPVEKVLEEKRAREAEKQKLRDEATRRDRERHEQIRKEREEKIKKRKEEEEKRRQEREKSKQAAKATESDSQDAKDSAEDNKDTKDPKDQETKEDEVPKENGDPPATEVSKPEPMETNLSEPMETNQSEPQDQDKNQEEATEIKPEPKEDDAAKEVAMTEVTEEQVFGGLKLDPRIKFVIRYIVTEELSGEEACLVPGYVLIAHMYLDAGPRRPARNSDCVVILMVGMPGAGKTHWAREYAAKQPERRFNIISTGALFDKMKVDCKPFRSSYEGRWDAMVSKCAKCVLKMLEIAQGRRRNYILDQTNVYPSAQRRKLREFDGYKRIAVVVVPDEATYEERRKKRELADGKEVPDGAILDMKANFSLPEKCSWLEEVMYAELQEEEAKAIIDKFHKEAKTAGVQREKEKRERSPPREVPPAKRARSDDRRGPPPRESRGPPRDFGRDRVASVGETADRSKATTMRGSPRGRLHTSHFEDRWGGGGGGGGGGGSRWGSGGGGGGAMGGGRGGRDGGGGGGGGRWDRQPPGRPFERPRMDGGFGGGREFRDFGGRGDGGFRGGRGSGPGPRGDRGGPARPPPMDGGRPFGRSSDPPPRGGPPPDKRNQGNQGGGGSGGGGSWQRGGAMQTSMMRGGASGGAGGGPNRGGGAGPGPNRGGGRAPQSGPPAQRNQGPPPQQQRSNSEMTRPMPAKPRAKNENQTPAQTPGQNPQQNQANWNQWNNWGWGNWNQNQAGWGGWGNWGNWGANQGGAQGAAGGAPLGGAQGAPPNKGGGAQGQWPANYQQQWYQWQQWQQQQQQWQGQYQGNQAAGGTPEQQQMWAQYYQNYGNANPGGNAPGGDKKSVKDK